MTWATTEGSCAGWAATIAAICSAAARRVSTDEPPEKLLENVLLMG